MKIASEEKNLLSWMNPASDKFHALADFEKLETYQQALVTIATCLTGMFFVLPGVAVFRATVGFFNQQSEETGSKAASVASNVIDPAREERAAEGDSQNHSLVHRKLREKKPISIIKGVANKPIQLDSAEDEDIPIEDEDAPLNDPSNDFPAKGSTLVRRKLGDKASDADELKNPGTARDDIPARDGSARQALLDMGINPDEILEIDVVEEDDVALAPAPPPPESIKHRKLIAHEKWIVEYADSIARIINREDEDMKAALTELVQSWYNKACENNALKNKPIAPDKFKHVFASNLRFYIYLFDVANSSKTQEEFLSHLPKEDKESLVDWIKGCGKSIPGTDSPSANEAIFWLASRFITKDKIRITKEFLTAVINESLNDETLKTMKEELLGFFAIFISDQKNDKNAKSKNDESAESNKLSTKDFIIKWEKILIGDSPVIKALALYYVNTHTESLLKKIPNILQIVKNVNTDKDAEKALWEIAQLIKPLLSIHSDTH